MADITNNQEQVFRGVVQRVTFKNPENGYAVMQVNVADFDGPLTVVGNFSNATVGTNIMVRGVFKEHPRFGRQLSAKFITQTTPSSIEGIEKFLSSGFVKGIGEKTAKRLVKQFGTETIDIILKDPKKISQVSGIGRHKAFLLNEKLNEQRQASETLSFLAEHNIPSGLAQRIYQRYQTATLEIVSKNPYLLARQMRGVGFLTADSIAMNMGIKPDSPERLKAGLYYALEKAGEDGHCYLKANDLQQKACTLMELENVDLSEHIHALRQEDYIVIEDDAVFLKHMYKAEEFVAQFVAGRIQNSYPALFSDAYVEQCLAAAEKALSLSLSPEQRHSVHLASKERLLIITGGPGCGKTTIIRALSMLFREAKKRILLAAPTGRAAQRMAQVCEMPASTIHRLLKYDPTSGGFKFGINDPLVADCVIIDECSMLDINLSKDLLSAIPNNAHIVLVGDKDQLPSVGPGRFFADLISVNQIKTVSLTQLFRRSETSSINSVAHLVNSGIVPDVPQPDGKTKTDAYFLPRSDPEEAVTTIEKLVADQIPKKFGLELSDICVLTPSNRGPLGTEILNKKLQARLNPPGLLDAEQELEVNNTIFRIGDRVCQRVNNYNIDELGVFNGDVGIIYNVSRQRRELTVEMWDGRLIKYAEDEINQLSLAYAITVHRSQGSEFPCVVLALHDSHYALLEKQLIYTAITRAKKLLIVIGSKRAFTIACRKAKSGSRRTMLKERIQSQLRNIIA